MPTREDVTRLTHEIDALKKKRTQTMRAIGPEPICDYQFKTLEGTVMLSDLFDGRPDLILIHNMGRSCRWCTLWADGLAGVYKHLSNRAAFVLSSPDEPKVQAEFAASRAWPFRLVSVQGSTFPKDMGYMDPDGDPGPGVSVFHRTPD